MSEWKDEILVENLESLIDYRGKTPKKADEGILTLSAKSVKMGRINYEDAYHISKETYDKFMVRGFPKVGDILMTTEAPLGEVARLDREDVGLAQRLITLRGKAGVLENGYLMYYLMSNRGQYELHSRATGTTVQGIKRSEFVKVKINLPPLPEQKAIAHILGKLDDKIELNRKMNETLEGMAQALFKSWFVDFDPVLDNALAYGRPIPEGLQHKAEQRKKVADHKKILHKNPELAAQFPDSFIYNEKLNKWIPEGWEVKSLGDKFYVKGGFAYKSKDFVESNGIPVVKIKSIQSDKTIDKKNLSMVEKSIAMQRPEYHLENGDLLMAMTGATVGKFGILVKNDEEIIALNQRVAKFSSMSETNKSVWFIYCFFNEKKNMDFIINNAQGSAQPNISANEIMSAQFVFSNDITMENFEKIITPTFIKIIQNQKQTETLTKLRDTLLPQLISGKIRVPEEMVEGFEEGERF